MQSTQQGSSAVPWLFGGIIGFATSRLLEQRKSASAPASPALLRNATGSKSALALPRGIEDDKASKPYPVSPTPRPPKHDVDLLLLGAAVAVGILAAELT